MALSRIVAMSVVAASLLLSLAASSAEAQGITTGAIGGLVTAEDGSPLGGVTIAATNVRTGFTAGVLSRDDGRYFLQGLEVGMYVVQARRIGFESQKRDSQYVSLSQVLKLDFRLTARPTQLSGVRILAATTTETFTPTNTGIKATVTDSTIQRMATISRNLADFSRIAPQVSASGPGYSAGGMSNRMNNVQIDGATERDVFGLGATGQPGAEVNARSISLEAVKEVQVLLAPYDVRQGNFGGLLLNAVTKSGSNDLHGTAYYFYRNQNYGANVPVLRATPFDHTQYGFSLGGPIVKDKLHFFIAPEFQTEHSPLSGPYQGQPSSITPKFNFSDADVQSFQQVMTAKGSNFPGTAEAVQVPNPLRNFFGRLDWRINDTHRAVIRYNWDNGENPDRAQNFRTSTTAVFSSNLHDFKTFKSAPVVQLFSNFRNGTFNEMFLGLNVAQNRRTPLTTFPMITINTVNFADGSGTGKFIGGADQFSQGNELDQKTIEFTDNYTLPRGSHTLVFGTRNEYVTIRNLFTQSSFGVWSFKNLDSLAAGNANSFRKAIILSQGGNVYFDALQSAWYAQDQWQVSPRFAVTLGARFDISNFLKDVAYNAPIDSAYGRRTDDIPKHALQFSPRFGFNWDLTGDQRNQIRGGVGLFVGTPPYVWLENVYVNSGNIITFLNCNTSGSTAPAPAFTLDVSSISSCANGQGTKPIGDVNFLDKNLKFPQPMRAALGYDRQLPHDLVFSLEGLYSKTLNQFFFVNRNLTASTGTDPHGRVLYADSIRATNGVSFASVPAAVKANGGTARFSTAIDVINQSHDYAWNLTTSIRKRYSNHWEAYAAYTYGRAMDAQSFTSSTHISNYRFGRTYSGDQLDPTETISLFDQRHKVVASGSYSWEWKHGWGTDFSLFYQGVSGAPHDYVYNSVSSGSGDLNGDGQQGNDLIYVPNDAHDVSEIRFKDITGTVNGVPNTVITSATTQADAFEAFIKKSPCLSAHRGTILPRNSCRQPFYHSLDMAIRQNIPSINGQRVSVQLDIFNVIDALDVALHGTDKLRGWGQQKVTEATTNSNVPILNHVGMSSSDPKSAVPIFQFNTRQNEYSVGNFASNYYRMQLSVRYSF
jgi:outer membrane receptor protein involved in Fe transport